MEVEPLNETKLEEVGLNCNHNTPLSSREDPSFDKPEPQPQPSPNCPPLDASLGTERGFKPPIKPQSPDSFRMKVLDNLTIHTPPSSLVASFHLRDLYCYYRPCVDDPKKHYGFKPGLLGHSGSLGPYTSTIVTILAVPATDNTPAVPERTAVETILNMSPENKVHFELEKEAIHLLLTGIGDEIYSTVDLCKTS
ncbi:hypothetical protein Tco_1409549 [Tanacetum coccineum]